jgi:hypothetical protein
MSSRTARTNESTGADALVAGASGAAAAALATVGVSSLLGACVSVEGAVAVGAVGRPAGAATVHPELAGAVGRAAVATAHP